MKSIRQSLTLSLLLGFSLLFGASAAFKYWYFHRLLAEQFDATLLARAVTIASSVKLDHNLLEVHFSEQVSRDISAVNELGYYQLWRINGTVIARSKDLDNDALPTQYSDTGHPKLFDATLPNGKHIRGVGFYFIPDPELDKDEDGSIQHGSHHNRPTIGIVVAADRAPLDRAVNHVMLIAAVTGVLTLVLAGVLIKLALQRSLRPLDQLAEQTRQLSAHTLKLRLPAGGVPQELTPIYERLNDLLGRLDSAFSEMSAYAGKVTHELRTPLTILRLKVEQAGERMSPELAEELQTELHHLAHVIDQSLLIARAEQGRVQNQKENFDLAAMVRDVAEDFSLIAAETDRQVLQSGISTPAPVSADPNHTRQIIHNLLTNAWKHGTGTICVRVKARGKRGYSLLIVNPMTNRAVTTEATLGLGLRVVGTLLALQPDIRCQRRHRAKAYAVRLTFPPAGN